ncbi:hypothetical protein TNCV_1205861 [Trichonephila clavipes]|nr:hypothetical protein TNCV_1205861 [Trichonephila clavipes]
MSRFGGLSEQRPSVFKTRSKLGTHLSSQCSEDENKWMHRQFIYKDLSDPEVLALARLGSLINGRGAVQVPSSTHELYHGSSSRDPSSKALKFLKITPEIKLIY